MLAATQPFTKGCALCHAPANPMSSSSRSFVIAAERWVGERGNFEFPFGGRLQQPAPPLPRFFKGRLAEGRKKKGEK